MAAAGATTLRARINASYTRSSLNGLAAETRDTTPARAATDAQAPPHTRYLWSMLLARIYEIQAQGWACLARPWMQVFPLLCHRRASPWP